MCVSNYNLWHLFQLTVVKTSRTASLVIELLVALRFVMSSQGQEEEYTDVQGVIVIIQLI